MGVLGFSHVRFAEPADEERLFDFLMFLYEENALFPIAEHKVRDMIRHATDKRGGVIGIIDGADGRIEASIGMVIEEWWYTESPSLNEKWNFVREDCRRTEHAVTMIEFAKTCSERLSKGQMQIPLFIGIVSTERTEAKVRMYRRRLQHVGGFFMHNLLPPALRKTRKKG